jgi:hypothetical protein
MSNGLRFAKAGARKSKRAKPQNLESKIQQAVIVWRDYNVSKYPDLRWLHAIPNGGGRSAAQAGILKAEGVTPGVWDLSLPVCRGPYTGMVIELKKPGLRDRKNRGLTQDQVEFGIHQKFEGRFTAIHDDAFECIEMIKKYLALGATT